MGKGRLLLRAVRAAQEPKASQSQLARKAGLALFRYWQIENGEGPEPTKDEQAAVAAALGVKVSDISWPNQASQAAPPAPPRKPSPEPSDLTVDAVRSGR